ncbi:hypothetical protein SGLAM104S_01654 [Streptomyces glaucescens]
MNADLYSAVTSSRLFRPSGPLLRGRSPARMLATSSRSCARCELGTSGPKSRQAAASASGTSRAGVIRQEALR